MYVYIICGATGQGKSTFARKLVSKFKNHQKIVFDINNEYSDETDWIRDTTCDKAAFTDWVCERDENNQFITRNSVILLEDATGFFSSKVQDVWVQFAQAKRHTGNVVIFLFHSLYPVPKNMMQFANYTVLFQTNDELPDIKKKFPSYLSAVVELKRSPKYSRKIIENYKQ